MSKKEKDVKKSVEEEIKEEVKEEVKEKEESSDDRYIRLYADYQNLKKRSENDRQDARLDAKIDVAKEILPVLDNFERALEIETEDEKFKEGVMLILKQLKDALNKVGVKEIEALGTDFDPNYHSAVLMEDSEEYESGKVTAVIQKGYMINNRVIRPSMVKVAN